MGGAFYSVSSCLQAESFNSFCVSQFVSSLSFTSFCSSLFRLPLKRGAHITLFFLFVNPYFHSVFTNFAELAFHSGEENCLLGEGANYRHPPNSLQAFFEEFLKGFCRSAQQLNRCIAKRPIRRFYQQISQPSERQVFLKPK